MIKILFPSVFKYSRRGGVTVYIKLLTDNLDKHKYKIIDLSHDENAKIKKQNLGTLKNRFLSRFLIFYFRLTFKKNITIHKPDIIYLNPSLRLFAIIRDFSFLKVSKEMSIPTLFFIHGWDKSLYNKIKNNRNLKRWFVKNLSKADAVAVLASRFKQELTELGIDEKKIFILTTMVKTEKYYSPQKEFNLPFNVLFCSNMNREKGVYEFLESAKSVIKKYPSTKFILMGEGKELENLKIFARKLYIENNVKFVGFLTGDKKIEIYKKSHLFVFPSYSEGFPTVILEAMAAGLSVITTPVGGLKDEFLDGKNGFIIRSMLPRPKEISQLILKLLKDPKLMKKISEENIKDAKEKFDVIVVSSKIEEICKSLLEV